MRSRYWHSSWGFSISGRGRVVEAVESLTTTSSIFAGSVSDGAIAR